MSRTTFVLQTNCQKYTSRLDLKLFIPSNSTTFGPVNAKQRNKNLINNWPIGTGLAAQLCAPLSSRQHWSQFLEWVDSNERPTKNFNYLRMRKKFYLDRIHVFNFPRLAYKRRDFVRLGLRTATTYAANTMNVVYQMLWEVVVDDMSQFFNVQTSENG